VELDEFFFEQLAKKAPHAESVWQSVIYNMVQNGEPGFYNSALAHKGEQGDVRGCNPCAEITLEEWESCNLGHINLAEFGDDLEGACEAARLMTRFLIRATECDVTDPRQQEVTKRNRRIGVGLFGVQEWAATHSVKWSEIPESDKLRHFIQDMAQVIEEECESYSHELRIPRPIKSRCIAPTGTISKLAGRSEGIHPIYARHYIQRIRYAHNDPNLDKHRELGRHIEDCQYSANTSVVSIPTRNTILDHFEPDLIESVDEIPLDSLFEVQAWFQEHWADNAISFTANIDPDLEPIELSRALRKWLPHLKGTTVFPDLSRPQSPYERIPDGVYEIIEGVMGGHEETGQAFDDCASGACPVR
jgi:ribonucleoside-triphosphate reductase